MRFVKYDLLLFGLVFLCMSNSYAFDKEAVHPAINDKSADESCLDDVLKENGLPSGKEEKMMAINGDEKTVIEWFKQGGTDEDKPVSRTLNHFHDPTQEWVEAELWGWLGASSVIWAQNVEDNDASWGNVLEHSGQVFAHCFCFRLIIKDRC